MELKNDDKVYVHVVRGLVRGSLVYAKTRKRALELLNNERRANGLSDAKYSELMEMGAFIKTHIK